MTSSSSSPPLSLSIPLSSLSRNYEHDVFLSFHGADVRKAFLSHILKEFRNKGINTFIDNKMKRGEFIGPVLKKAIQGSRIKIVLLSKRYASSSWCLNELVEIMKCQKELGQTVIPIFYEVDPTDVKKHTGDFGNVFSKTCAGKTIVVIGEWSRALAEVATITGYHSKQWHCEADMIEEITGDISKMLNHSTASCDFDRLIGMGAHMRKLEPLLSLDLKEVRMIGIWGPPGIGKSTIARYLFNQVSSSFQLSTIMVNIKGNYPRLCLDEYSATVQLQKQLLSQLFNDKDIDIPHLGVVRDRLKDKKVLVVLDDVDQSEQLDAMAEKTQWFGPGSRIIVTTEDLRVLEAHRINIIYKVDFPSYDEAFQIFCMNAFGQNSPKDGFAELAHEVTYLAGELPLGLKVMGSHFREMSKQKWKIALPRLRNSLDGKIESTLMFSYNSLRDEDKDLFLHIACFFNHEHKKRVEEYLEGSFRDVEHGLQVLADKALISIDFFGYIEMHKLLVQLGKEIIRKQSARKPWKRLFLVDERDICEVLNNDTAIAKSVIGMDSILLSKDGELNISERAFEGMSNLQFLRISGAYDHPSLPGRLNYIFPKLRLLDWRNSTMTYLPFIVNLECLVELTMIYSKLEKLWEGTKPLRNLKRMDLSFSENLTELPNLSTATSLKELYLCGCSSLVELPSSIGDATNLQNLNLSHCSSLVELPSSIGNATNLQKLNLCACSRLVELPFSIGDVTNLQNLILAHCSSLVELPSSIGNATNLQKLNLNACSSLVELPFSIGDLTNLQKLMLCDCSSLVELPSSIGNATNLQKLNLWGCSSLVELPSSIRNATNLRIIW